MNSLHEHLAVVILTHNRVEELRRTLSHMTRLSERPQIVVVDNASSDTTAGMVASTFPQVRLITLEQNIGAAARNVGVQAVRTPYVAFCDDDTWWRRDALVQAAGLLDEYPQVAILSARVLVGSQQHEDPTCALMANSPLPAAGLPGPALLGFLAGACVVRRQAFMDAGGYEPHFFIGGEEALLTLDLLASGWSVVYAPQLTVHHFPSCQRNSAAREHFLARNALWVAWMRLPLKDALRDTLGLWKRPYAMTTLSAAFISALRGLPWALGKRKVVPQDVVRMLQLVQQQA